LKLVRFLKHLGISHVYASPIFDMAAALEDPWWRYVIENGENTPYACISISTGPGA
jgi:maltooligosyltrehalose synthase